MSFLVRVANMILLHIIWLICCIPVVTIGPATTAAYVIAGRIVRDEGVSVTAQFLSAFRANFRKSLQVEAVLLVLGFMFFFDCSLMYHIIIFPVFVQTVMWGTLIFIGLCCWIEVSYIWLLIPRYKGSLKELFYYAIVLAVTNVKDTLQMFVENVALLTVFIISCAYFPQIAILYFIFGAPLFFLINAEIIRNVLERTYK